MRTIFTTIAIAIASMAFVSAELKPVDTAEAVTFTIKNFGINTRGEIKGLKGTIKWDAANPAASVFNVTADAKTVNTGIEMRDNHLRKEEYLNVEKYPLISFASTSVTGNTIKGNLTIKGVTKEISFPFTVKPSNGGYLFEGSFDINRRDFGVGGGSVSLSNNLSVSLKVQAK
ncbi:YceI family protein [Panacibacter sp. DH6]|uniref:YceI family protein n=1 Tax=Panacibacter microcysteis TaxID=2793269 RepID=A0A931E525_9BACT|nr:YceI family protein [Panacibacter microcysteis]MBG9375651.1 YceI family protein [Panacibacter microcysteis]